MVSYKFINFHFDEWLARIIFLDDFGDIGHADFVERFKKEILDVEKLIQEQREAFNNMDFGVPDEFGEPPLPLIYLSALNTFTEVMALLDYHYSLELTLVEVAQLIYLPWNEYSPPNQNVIDNIQFILDNLQIQYKL